MAKKYYFKKFYLIQTINLYVIRFVMYILRPIFPRNREMVLIKSSDGIGDILIRSELCKKIIEKYGKNNVYFLINKEYLQLGEILGYNCITFSQKEKVKFLYRIRKMYELNRMGFQKYINLEFELDITVGNLMIPERISMIEENERVARNNKYLTRTFEREKKKYVLDTVAHMGRKILKEEITKEDITPSLKNIFKDGKSGITIGVGTSSRNKVTSPHIMVKYIEELKKKYPEEKIILLGYGKEQVEYSKILIEKLPHIKFENLVGKLELKETFSKIASSKFFIGFDSGLYNFAYVIQKPTIAFFALENACFSHMVPWVKILVPSKKENSMEIIKDKMYSNIKMNSISVEDFKNALQELKC